MLPEIPNTIVADIKKFFAASAGNVGTFALATVPTMDTILKVGQILLVIISCCYTVYLWRKVRLEIKNLEKQNEKSSTPPSP